MLSGGSGFIVAFGGGIISFISPCVLPIVPAYLSMVTGIDLGDAADGASHHLGRIIRETLLFIAGFGLVFVLLGISATAVGETLFRNHVALTRASGVVLLVMSVMLAGAIGLRAPWLYREARFHPRPSRFGPLYAPIAGVAFGFGWTPCIGPVLASVEAVALTERGIGRGALLLAFYAAGLGLSFLIVGCGFARLTGALAFVRKHTRSITLCSSILLAGFGVLLILNRLTWVTSEIETALRAIGLGRIITIG